MNVFHKIKASLNKTKNNMVTKVETLIHTFTKIDEDFFDQMEEALILSDVGTATSAHICDVLRERVKAGGITNPAEIKDLLQQVIAEMLQGGEQLQISSKPSIILMIGVNGAGKTTTVGKLAASLKMSGKQVIVGAADTFRAAAIEQLEVWTNRAGVPLVKHQEGADPAAVVYDTIAAGKARGTDVIICDTAGRLHNKKNLMEELSKITRIIDREMQDCDREILLVLDATTGQNAVNQARLFQQATGGLTGIILTKLDGTARGGIVISIKNELDLPVKYIGVGEKLDDLQPFDPQMFAQALFADEGMLPESNV